MANTLLGKDMLATSDWTKDELDQVLDLAFKLKRMGAASRSLDILKGKTLLLLFLAPSTRTRTSFTAAMQELGGFVHCPDPKDIWLNLEEDATKWTRFSESIKDTAIVLDGYVHALAIRQGMILPEQLGGRIPTWNDPHIVLEKFAHYMKAPVINMSAEMHHPTQSLNDIFTMKEKLGDVRGKKNVLMWAYTPFAEDLGSAQGHSLIAATFGMNATIVCPEEYNCLDPGVMSTIQKECTKNGMKFEITHDLKKGLEGADTVYPRNWRTRVHLDAAAQEEEQRLAAKYRDWRLSDDLMKLTNNARFMHTMPFSRGNNVDASVADGPNSIIYDQAWNLRHVRKALLASLIAESSVLEKI